MLDLSGTNKIDRRGGGIGRGLNEGAARMQTERRPFSLKWRDGAVYIHLGQGDPAKTHGMLGSCIRYFDVMSRSIS
jgi:hypothetical protein